LIFGKNDPENPLYLSWKNQKILDFLAE